MYQATEAALAPYMTVRRQVERLSDDPKTMAEAGSLLQAQLEALYNKLQAAIQAEVDFNRANADEAGSRIQETISKAEGFGLLVSLTLGVILSLNCRISVGAGDQPSLGPPGRGDGPGPGRRFLYKRSSSRRAGN